MNPPQQTARQQLESAVRHKDRARQTRQWVATLGVIAAVLLGLTVLDYAISLPPIARWCGLALWMGVLVAGTRRILKLRRQTTRIEEAARDVEASRPEFGCEISTAAEYLSGARRPTKEYEAEIAAALEQQAASDLKGNTVPYSRNLVVPAGLTLAGLMAVLLGFATFAPGAFTSLLRATVPWSKASLTRIEPSLGSGEFAIGTGITLTNRLSGRIPKGAEFQYREEGTNVWQSAPILVGADRTARHAFRVSRSMTWRIAAGDGVSPEFNLTAYTPPEIRELAIRLSPPAYTRLPFTEQKNPAITTLRGTRALFRIDANVPLGQAALQFTNGVVMALRQLTNQLWVADLTITNDNAYGFLLADTRGRAALDHSIHLIRALPDEAPKIDFTKPGQDIRALATNTVPLEMAVSDDFGIASVKVLFHKLGEPEREVAVDRGAFKDGKLTAAARLALAPLQLRDYELVAYHAEATDNNDFDGPGIGRSSTYFIEVTDKEGKEGPKPKSQGKSEKVNLLTLQKQIIADTAALSATAPADKFKELAQRQRDALEFAKLYQTALMENAAPLAAQGHMNSAVTRMETAATELDRAARRESLPPEEGALADLYQTIRAMPQLQNLPTRLPKLAEGEPQPPPPPAVRVVLEEIEKKKEQDPNRKELEAALEQLQAMAETQAELAAAAQVAADAEAKAAQPGDSRHPEAGQPATTPPETTAQSPGQTPAPGEGKGEGKGEGEPKDQTDPSDPSQLPKLAPKQEQLSQQAKALAERLARVATQGQRAGHNPGQGLQKTAAQMKQAAKAMRSQNAGAASSAGANSGAGLQSSIATLQRLLEGRATLTDISSEEAPARYEAPISDYFKRLSRAE